MRYIGEVRFRLVGAPTPEKQAKAQGYFSYGRKLLGLIENRDMTLGLLPNASQRDVLPNGTVVTAAISYGVAVVTIDITGSTFTEESDRGELQLGLRWEPEGLMLTPTTADQKTGWGLPRRSMEPDGARIIDEFPLGTPGGNLPQVLLNRFANNKYHDDPRLLSGGDINFPDLIPETPSGEAEWEPPLSRFSYATELPGANFQHIFWRKSDQFCSYSEPDEAGFNGTYIFANAGYVAYSSAGVRDTTDLGSAPIVSQNQVVETETNEWFAHRPEELLATSETRELVWYKSNVEREKVGKNPCGRELRGEQNVSDFSVKNIVDSASEIFTHSYYGWTPGQRTAAGRLQNATGSNVLGLYGDNFSENIQIYDPNDDGLEGFTPDELSDYIVQSWVNSPSHYAAMISDLWDEYFLPYWQYVPNGTTSATLSIGTDTNQATISKLWDKQSKPPGPFIVADVDPPMVGQAWSQTWCIRSTWLPICSTTDSYALGTTGLFGSTCPYNRNHYLNTRSFVHNNVIYDIPQGNELPGTIADDIPEALAENDYFMTCLGVAPFEKTYSPPEEGAADVKQVWLRGVYWKSLSNYYSYFWDATADGKTPDEDSRPYPQDGVGAGQLVVLIWPEGLGESPIVPWGEDFTQASAMGFEVEFEETFTTAENWVPESEGLVRFNSTGTKFIIELERADPKKVTEGIDYYRPTNVPDVYDDLYKTFPTKELRQPFLAIQRVPMVYEDKALTELYTNNPIEAVVDSKIYEEKPPPFAEVYYQHNVVVNGEYRIYPHFDAEDNIKWCRLLIDEKYLQYHDPDDSSFPGRFDPRDPKITDRTNCKGYRRRVLVFPSGKEFVYMQQYLVQNFCVSWTPDARPPGFEFFPGDGQNFTAIIHEFDERAERVIYGKHTTDTYFNYMQTDPLGNTVPWLARGIEPTGPDRRKFYYTRGDSTYHLDMGSGDDRVEELLASYPGTQDHGWPRYVEEPNQSEYTRFIKPYSLYQIGCTPYRYTTTVTYEGSSYIYYRFPQNCSFSWPDEFADVSRGSDREGGAYDEMFRMTPNTNYYVSVTGMRDLYSQSNQGGAARYQVQGNFKYGGEASGVPFHNVAPMFSNDDDSRAKFVQYKDRWICRLELREIARGCDIVVEPRSYYDIHLNWPADGGGPLPAPDGTGLAEFLEKDYPYNNTCRFLDGNGSGMKSVRKSNGTAVHLKANFDLDEATGVDGIIDISPFGKI